MMYKLLILLALPTLLWGQSTQTLKWVKTDTMKSRTGTGKITAEDSAYVIYTSGNKRNLDIGPFKDSLFHAWNGSFLESFDATISSNGTTIKLALEKTGTGDLTTVFSSGFTALDCTPADSITLTPGSDISPQENYVYILESTGALTLSTSDWPSAEHIKVSYVVLQSAATTQTYGALINQNWNDHVTGTTGQGHLSHIAERLRREGAAWHSGTVPTLTITTGSTPDDVDISITSGTIYQMHLQTYAAHNSATGSPIFIVNHNSAPYTVTTDLETKIDSDAVGGSMTNKYFNIVLWGVANKGGTFAPMMINLSNGSYNIQSDATNDVSGYDVFDIPETFRSESSTGFLIAKYTLKHTSAGGGGHTLIATVDLRGLRPSSAVGAGALPSTVFADNAFYVFDETDVTKTFDFQVSGVSTATRRTMTIPDTSGKLLLDADTSTFLATAYDLSLISGADSNSWIATDYDVSLKLNTAALDTGAVLYWADTTLANGVATDYDLSLKATLSAVLKNADSTTQRTYSNSLYLKNADSTSIRDYSTSLYAPKASPTFTGMVTTPDARFTTLAPGGVPLIDSDGDIVISPDVSTAEFNFLDGVSAAIQSQLNAKAPKASPTFTTQIITPIVYGSSLTGGNLTLSSTSHATKGKIYLGSGATSAYDEVNDRLGIGTASPDYPLHVTGSGSVFGVVGGVWHMLGMDVSTLNANKTFRLGSLAYGNGDETIGFVMTNTSTANTVLYGGGTALGYAATLLRFYTATNSTTTTGTERMRIGSTGIISMYAYGAGTATFDASGNISSVSDERLKDIQDNFKYGLSALKDIKPIIYKWNKESGLEMEHEYVGFSAQNVQESIPLAVSENPQGYLSFQDRAIIAALVNAVNELSAKVDSLQKVIAK